MRDSHFKSVSTSQNCSLVPLVKVGHLSAMRGQQKPTNLSFVCSLFENYTFLVYNLSLTFSSFLHSAPNAFPFTFLRLKNEQQIFNKQLSTANAKLASFQIVMIGCQIWTIHSTLDHPECLPPWRLPCLPFPSKPASMSRFDRDFSLFVVFPHPPKHLFPPQVLFFSIRTLLFFCCCKKQPPFDQNLSPAFPSYVINHAQVWSG